MPDIKTQIGIGKTVSVRGLKKVIKSQKKKKKEKIS